MSAGYTDRERGKFKELLAAGFTDTFRELHPTEQKYSWWSYMRQAREHNIGWRIDYFLISSDAAGLITKADILTDVEGSDHAPILLEVNL